MFTLQHQKLLTQHGLKCGDPTLPELLSLPDLQEYEKELNALLSSRAFALFAVEMELIANALESNLDACPTSIADLISREQTFGERRGHRTATEYFLSQKTEVAKLIQQLQTKHENE